MASDPPGFQRSRLIENPSTRFFLITSSVGENVVKSVERKVWATQIKNEERLNEAFSSSAPVILIFSVLKSGSFQGYARMRSLIGRSSARSNPFGGPAHALFDVEWLRLTDLEFDDVQHLRNSIDNNRQVTHTRDGQELDHRTGAELCRRLDILVFEEDPETYEPVDDDDTWSKEKASRSPTKEQSPPAEASYPGPPGYGYARPPPSHGYPHPYGYAQPYGPPGAAPLHYPPAPHHYHHHHHHHHAAFPPPARPPPGCHAAPPHPYAAAQPLSVAVASTTMPPPSAAHLAYANPAAAVAPPRGPFESPAPGVVQGIPLERKLSIQEASSSYYSESEEPEEKQLKKKEKKKAKKEKKKEKKAAKKVKKEKKEKKEKAKKEKKSAAPPAVDAPDFKKMSYEDYLRWWHATHPAAAEAPPGAPGSTAGQVQLGSSVPPAAVAAPGSMAKPQVSPSATMPGAQATQFPVIVLD
mmetsp:Transcript_60209/g.143518  ORF Transcript_60209/g.143518 Transcript_60209/m.143518 type:complete len:469 (-) Transcript_60209:118-1524(-)